MLTEINIFIRYFINSAFLFFLTFEIRFIQRWLDLGGDSNPQLPGTCQLLIKVKYRSKLKPQKEGAKCSISKGAAQQCGTLSRV